MCGSVQTAVTLGSQHLPMSPHTPYARAFRRAIEIVGSVEEVAGAVGASVKEVEAWAAGLAHPPHIVFMKAIEVIGQRRTGGDAAKV
jgi:hypothetical protein